MQLMLQKKFVKDARYFQVFCQLFFLGYGILWIGWKQDWLHYSITIVGCLFFNYATESIRLKKILPLTGQSGWTHWGLSVLISALSICLLLKTNHWYTSLLAACLTVSSKYFLRFNKKHIFNPSAFGIVATILLTNDAWLSPGQWGEQAVLFFFITVLGIIVVTRVQKLDASLSFLLTFGGLLFWRQVYVLGWPLDYFRHSIGTGSLLLFSFFMISDPKTSPNHPLARTIWAMMIAVIAFYLAAFEWLYNTPILVLVFAAPLVPLMDRIFKAKVFEWSSSFSSTSFISNFKKIVMKSVTKKFAAILVLLAMTSHEAMAFCGFYVSKADGTLKNKTSQVIIVRDGNRNVITMYNDFKGNMKDFAMVVPVPVVLKKSDIKVVDQQIFKLLNEYSQPRLVEYYDQNPCESRENDMADMIPVPNVVLRGMASGVSIDKKDHGVKIEAKYLVGEYDILILSAKESSGLQTWLIENGYKIPNGANEVLEPYIRSNMKFFVVKVNEEEKKKLPGNFLRPIQISFSSPKFMLPIRLGMANADGDQDMIVYAFSKKGRIECTNYRTIELPTGKKIPLFVQNNFANFYSNLFQYQWRMQGKAITMLEYAWNVSPSNYLKCDPCVAAVPTSQDLLQAGVWWLGGNTVNPDNGQDENVACSDNVYFTRLHVRYNRDAFPQDLMFQETPNAENFQARYIITHPATGDFNCEAGKKYLKELKERRHDELEMLTYLTGKSYSDWDLIVNSDEEKFIPGDDSYATINAGLGKNVKKDKRILLTVIVALCVLPLTGMSMRRKKERG